MSRSIRISRTPRIRATLLASSEINLCRRDTASAAAPISKLSPRPFLILLSSILSFFMFCKVNGVGGGDSLLYRYFFGRG